jgi:hypothetical protein
MWGCADVPMCGCADVRMPARPKGAGADVRTQRGGCRTSVIASHALRVEKQSPLLEINLLADVPTGNRDKPNAICKL